MPRDTTLPIAHFERLYAGKPDPWRYASSPYEGAKYAATVAALPQARFRNGLDVGCSIGVLTSLLAARCDALLGIEPVEAALAEARTRNAHWPQVRFARMAVPAEWPAERFDLVVISEVLDYLGEADLSALAGRLTATLETGGTLMLVHWVGKKGPHSDGFEASDVLGRLLEDVVEPLSAARNADYRMDVFGRR